MTRTDLITQAQALADSAEKLSRQDPDAADEAVKRAIELHWVIVEMDEREAA